MKVIRYPKYFCRAIKRNQLLLNQVISISISKNIKIEAPNMANKKENLTKDNKTQI